MRMTFRFGRCWISERRIMRRKSVSILEQDDGLAYSHSRVKRERERGPGYSKHTPTLMDFINDNMRDLIEAVLGL